MTTLPQTTSMRIARQPGAAPMMVPGSPTGMPPGGAGSATTAKQMTGGDAWRVIRSNMWLILLSVIVAGVLGYVVNRFVLLKYFARYTATGYVQIVQPPDPIDPEKTRMWGENMQQVSYEQRTHAQLLRIDLSRITVDGRPFSDVLSEFTEQLKLIKSSLENRDFVSLIDTLVYETAETSANWRAAIRSMRSVIDVKS